MPADQVLTVTFSEPVTVSQSSFTLTCDSNPVAFTIGGTATAATLTPTSDLPGTAACILTVVAAQVFDVDAGDPPDTMTADVTVDFTTVDTAPTVVSTSPTNGATDVSSGATVTVTFSEPVTADAGAFTLECPAGTPRRSPSAARARPSGPSRQMPSCPPPPCAPSRSTGSKIHDVDAVDPPDEMAADVTVDFTVAANSAPTDLALSPTTVAENQPSGTTVGTFSSTDPDVGDTFTYTLAAGAGDTDNGSFTIVGDELRTAASFDFEAKASYSVNVRTTDSAGNVFEKSFTITVTNVNEAPTDIALSNASVAENEPAGTVVGTLSATDQDAGQTHTFTVVTAGCGNTYPDGSSFTVNAGSLVTAASLDYEAKSSYSVCVRVTDDGTPGLTFDKLFTITVTNVNEAPVVGGDSYSGVIGNTLALRGVTATGPSTALTGALPLANDTDPEGDTLSVVAGTLATIGGGSVTINADGTFSYLPGVGDVSQTDTVTYTVTDGQLSSTGTISIAIGSDRVWWVDGAAAPGGDGRSTTPLATLTTLNGAGGAGDVDGPSDYLFVYAAPGAYAGGLALEANQRLHGQRFGLTIGGTVLVPAGVTAPDDHQRRGQRRHPRQRGRRPGRHGLGRLGRRHPRRQHHDRDARQHRHREQQRPGRHRPHGRRHRLHRGRRDDLRQHGTVRQRRQPLRRHDVLHRTRHRHRHHALRQHRSDGHLHRPADHLVRHGQRLQRHRRRHGHGLRHDLDPDEHDRLDSRRRQHLDRRGRPEVPVGERERRGQRHPPQRHRQRRRADGARRRQHERRRQRQRRHHPGHHRPGRLADEHQRGQPQQPHRQQHPDGFGHQGHRRQRLLLHLRHRHPAAARPAAVRAARSPPTSPSTASATASPT